MSWRQVSDHAVTSRRCTQRFACFRCTSCKKLACLPEGMTVAALGTCSCSAVRP